MSAQAYTYQTASLAALSTPALVTAQDRMRWLPIHLNHVLERGYDDRGDYLTWQRIELFQRHIPLFQAEAIRMDHELHRRHLEP